jgi:hypothetical protein
VKEAMRFNLRFLLMVIMPYVAGMDVIWRLSQYTGRSASERDVYALFRVLFLAWFTIAWVFVGWLMTMWWSRKNRKSKRE